MDFLEQLFGLSLDGGTGMLELSILVVAISVVAIKFLWLRREGHHAVAKIGVPE